MSDTSLLSLSVALLIGLPAFGSCIGIGLATMKFLESAARQPELIPELQTKYFLGVGVTDGASSSQPGSACGSPRPTRSRADRAKENSA
ncbi:Lipid-binding protein [Methylibium sp. T29]|nr:Lipid-binding protein [Methylibium sp. T29]